MNILSIDYGRKRMGLASNLGGATIAFALDPIFVKDEKNTFERLSKEIKDNKIEKIIIGVPLGLEEKETQMSLEVREFIKVLKDNFGLKIVEWNETLTSKQASQNLRPGSKKRSIDSESARIILQEFLDHSSLK